ncbi:hypothetical protein ABBQ38_011234 [Trebouxia sp. C0009 RCD-2024]
MAPQIQRARAALRAIHRMDALMRASHDAQADVEAGQQPAQGTQASEDGLQQPLLGSDRTPPEAAAADFRTSRSEMPARRRPPSALNSFRGAVQDIQEAQQHLNRANSSMAGLSDAERRAKVLGMFAGASSWRGGTGMGLPKEIVTADSDPGPGWFAFKSDVKAIYGLIMSSWMNVLLVMAPLGILSHYLHWGPVAVFLLNFAALIPLALLLGEVTEDLAVRFGSTIGGLLNATFGNVVELILSIAALTKGLYVVIAASLIGSILSNLLLVLGCCFLLGGAKHKHQKFNTMLNKACCSLLLLACIGLVIPTAANIFFPDTAGNGEQPPIPRITTSGIANMSHATSLILGFVYLCYLFFQLKTHADELAEGGGEEAPALSLFGALSLLTVITLIVATNSEFLTGAIEAVSAKSGLNQTFLGLIILPIAGNACEHITAVFVAMKDKMDLAIGVALGSSIQIAIFVIPFMVITAWCMGLPFYLDFEPFATMVLTLAVIHAFFVSSDGNSNWLLGVLLVATYILIALLYLFLES